VFDYYVCKSYVYARKLSAAFGRAIIFAGVALNVYIYTRLLSVLAGASSDCAMNGWRLEYEPL
jgi:hypothetical protein